MTMRPSPAPHGSSRASRATRRRRTLAAVTTATAALTLAACIQPAKPPHAAGPNPGPGARALRFFGTGSGQVDRVKIPLNGNTRANIGAGDFTIEIWIRGALGDNGAGNNCSGGEAAWINGNIFIDRDVFGGGDVSDAVVDDRWTAADASTDAVARAAGRLRRLVSRYRLHRRR